MTGGKSSSSNESKQETVSSSATGVAGDVFQGKEITINQELPDSVENIVSELLGIVGQSLDLTAAAGAAAIEKVSDRTQAATQPDLTLAQSSVKNIPYIIGAVALVAVVFLWRKK